MIDLRSQTARYAQSKGHFLAVLLFGLFLFLPPSIYAQADSSFGDGFKNAESVRLYMRDKMDYVFMDICPIPSEGNKKRNVIYFSIIANGVGMPQKLIVLFKLIEEHGQLKQLQQVLKQTDAEGMNILRYIERKRGQNGHNAKYLEDLRTFERTIIYYMNK